jgi:DNA-binding transcriptional regulator LsrR (DeoR family)
VTVAVVGVGEWAAGESTIHDLLSPAEQRELTDQGVLGEVAGVFFDHEGRVCHPSLAERLVTLGEKELCGIPEVIAVVSGASKREAVRATLRGGLVHSLVTDAELARALLAGE